MANQAKVNYPRKIEESYSRDMQRLINDWNKCALAIFDEYFKTAVKGGTSILTDGKDNHTSSSSKTSKNAKFKQLINSLDNTFDLMAFTIKKSTPDQRLTQIATKFVKAINSFSYNHVKLKTAITGINPIQQNGALDDYVKTNIGYNTSLIKSMMTNYINSLKDDIYRSITKGTGGGITDITNAIRRRTGMAKAHAELIANDQTGSIVSQVDSYRAKSAGATSYIWRSMEDDRVRPEHEDLDGKEFDYDDPNGGDDGQLPGEPIRCRCYAEPIFD